MAEEMNENQLDTDDTELWDMWTTGFDHLLTQAHLEELGSVDEDWFEHLSDFHASSEPVDNPVATVGTMHHISAPLCASSPQVSGRHPDQRSRLTMSKNPASPSGREVPEEVSKALVDTHQITNPMVSSTSGAGGENQDVHARTRRKRPLFRMSKSNKSKSSPPRSSSSSPLAKRHHVNPDEDIQEIEQEKMPMLEPEETCFVNPDEPPDLSPERVAVDKLQHDDEAPQLEPQNSVEAADLAEKIIIEDPPQLEKQESDSVTSRKAATRGTFCRTPEPPLLVHSDSTSMDSPDHVQIDEDDPPFLSLQVDPTSILREPPRLDRFDSQDIDDEMPPVLEAFADEKSPHHGACRGTQKGMEEEKSTTVDTSELNENRLLSPDVIGPSQPHEESTRIGTRSSGNQGCQTPIAHRLPDMESSRSSPGNEHPSSQPLMSVMNVTTPSLYSPSLPLGQQQSKMPPPLESPVDCSSQHHPLDGSVNKSWHSSHAISGHMHSPATPGKGEETPRSDGGKASVSRSGDSDMTPFTHGADRLSTSASPALSPWLSPLMTSVKSRPARGLYHGMHSIAYPLSITPHVIKSLGIDHNTSGASWTSSLATPPRNKSLDGADMSALDAVEEEDMDERRPSLGAARMLFSPGNLSQSSQDTDMELNDTIESSDECEGTGMQVMADTTPRTTESLPESVNVELLLPSHRTPTSIQAPVPHSTCVQSTSTHSSVLTTTCDQSSVPTLTLAHNPVLDGTRTVFSEAAVSHTTSDVFTTSTCAESLVTSASPVSLNSAGQTSAVSEHSVQPMVDFISNNSSCVGDPAYTNNSSGLVEHESGYMVRAHILTNAAVPAPTSANSIIMGSAAIEYSPSRHSQVHQSEANWMSDPPCIDAGTHSPLLKNTAASSFLGVSVDGAGDRYTGSSGQIMDRSALEATNVLSPAKSTPKAVTCNQEISSISDESAMKMAICQSGSKHRSIAIGTVQSLDNVNPVVDDRSNHDIQNPPESTLLPTDVSTRTPKQSNADDHAADVEEMLSLFSTPPTHSGLRKRLAPRRRSRIYASPQNILAQDEALSAGTVSENDGDLIAQTTGHNSNYDSNVHVEHQQSRKMELEADEESNSHNQVMPKVQQKIPTTAQYNSPADKQEKMPRIVKTPSHLEPASPVDFGFSQISPSSLNAMCEVANKSENNSTCSSPPSQDNTPYVPVSDIKAMKESVSNDTTSPSEQKRPITMQPRRLSLGAKPKRFAYPSTRQISETCPRKVFNFSVHPLKEAPHEDVQNESKKVPDEEKNEGKEKNDGAQGEKLKLSRDIEKMTDGNTAASRVNSYASSTISQQTQKNNKLLESSDSLLDSNVKLSSVHATDIVMRNKNSAAAALKSGNETKFEKSSKPSGMSRHSRASMDLIEGPHKVSGAGDAGKVLDDVAHREVDMTVVDGGGDCKVHDSRSVDCLERTEQSSRDVSSVKRPSVWQHLEEEFAQDWDPDMCSQSAKEDGIPISYNAPVRQTDVTEKIGPKDQKDEIYGCHEPSAMISKEQVNAELGNWGTTDMKGVKCLESVDQIPTLSTAGSLTKSVSTMQGTMKSNDFRGGFALASGKSIIVTEESLARAERLVSDIDVEDSLDEVRRLDTPNPDTSPSRGSLNSNRSASVVKNVMHEHRESLEKLEEKLDIGAPVGSVGFATAGGKAICISDSSLAAAVKLISEDSDVHDSSDNYPEIGCLKGKHNKETLSSVVENPGDKAPVPNDVKVSNETITAVSKTEQHLIGKHSKGPPRHNGYLPFKPVIPQKKSVNPCMTKALQYPKAPPEGQEVEKSGFKNDGAGAALSVVSSDAGEAARHDVNPPYHNPGHSPELNNNGEKVSPSACGGFSLASGRSITLSASALKKANQLIADIDSIDNNLVELNPKPNSVASGFASASGKMITMSSVALNKATRILSDVMDSEHDITSMTDSEVHNDMTVVPGSEAPVDMDCGEQQSDVIATAGDDLDQFEDFTNTQLQRMVESDDELEDLEERQEVGADDRLQKQASITEVETEVAKTLVESSASVEIVKKSDNSSKSLTNTQIAEIQRSTDAFISEDDDFSQLAHEDSIHRMPSGEVGQRDVSDTNALRRVDASTSQRSTADQLDPNSASLDSACFVGFQTGHGKPVLVSDAALNQAKGLISHIQDDGPEESGTREGDHLETGLVPDPTSLNDGSEASRNIAASVGSTHEQKFGGFMSGNGKPIIASESALKHAQKLLSEVSNSVSDAASPDGCIGFQTGLGKKIPVSESALARGTQLLYAVEEIESADCLALPTDSSAHFTTEVGKNNEVSACAHKKNMNNLVSETYSDSDIQHGLTKSSDSNVLPLSLGMNDCNELSNTTDNTIKVKASEDDSVMSSEQEKIAFVGFKTGGGRKIDVSKKALEKAKEILGHDEEPPTAMNSSSGSFQTADGQQIQIFEDEPSVPKHAKCSFQGFQTGSGKQIGVSEVALAKAKEILGPDDDPSTTEVSKDNFGGFQTGSGKHIEVSKDALAKAKENFEYNEKPSTSLVVKDGFGGFQTGGGRQIQVSKSALAKAKSILDDEPSAPEDVKGSFGGFQTGGGKQIHVSRSALAKAKSILDDETSISEDAKGSFSGFQTGGGKQIPVSKSALSKAKSILDDEPSVPGTAKGFDGFQTGGGRQIQVSKSALAKAKSILDDEPSVPETTKGFGGFQTGGGKQIQVSKSALVKAKSILDDEPSVPETAKGFGGFQTGDGKQIQVSKSALAKAREIIDEVEPAVTENNKGNFGGFQTGGGKQIQVSRSALAKAKSILDDETSISEDAKGSFGGFQTGGGKQIPVSKSALSKAKSILDDEPSVPGTAKGLDGFQTGGGRQIQVSKSALAKAKSILDDEPSVPETTKGFGGFQTGGGKQIQVSKSALVKAKSILDDEPSVPETAKGFGGFQTGDGKQIQVSKSALAKAREIIDEVEPAVTENNKGNFGGFQTGGGKQIQVSRSALAKAKSILDDETLVSEDAKGSFGGFQTGGGKQIQVSSAALAKAKDILKDEEVCTPIDAQQGFGGFQTGGVKQVKVSETALAEAKTLFKDNQDSPVSKNTKGSFGGFQTGGGKEIKVSEAALSKVKEIFKDETEPSQIVDASVEFTPFSGFQTGAGKSITVSDDALAKAKGILAETSEAPESLIKSEMQKERSEKCLGSGASIPVPRSVEKVEKCISSEAVAITYRFGNKNGEMPVIDPPIVHDIRTKAQMITKHPLSTHAENLLDDKTASALMDSEEKLADEETRTLHALVASGLFEDSWLSQLDPGTASKIAKYEVNSRDRQLKEGSLKTSPEGTWEDRERVSPQAAPQPILTRPPSDLLWAEQKVKKFKYRVESSKNPDSSTGPAFQTPYRKVEHAVPPSCSVLVKQSTVESGNVAVDSQAMDLEESKSDKPENKSSTTDASKLIRADPEIVKQRTKAKVAQAQAIRKKKKEGGVKPMMGSLFEQKSRKGRLKLVDVTGSRPQQYTTKQLYPFGVQSSTQSVSAATAEEFSFNLADFHGENIARTGVSIQAGDGAMLVMDETGCIGKQEFCNALLALESVEPGLISREWVFNHYRWIIWKLAALEIAFPSTFGARCLTPEQVMLQLKYRYDREIDRSQRSALKKIFERDDTAAKCMVLCVSAILSAADLKANPGKTAHNSPKEENKPESALACGMYLLELTDGWYQVRGLPDTAMCRLIQASRIRVGDKLAIYGAELLGPADACPPLEAPADSRLRLSANSTRRARWDARLGFCPRPQPPPLPLGSLLPDGGLVSCVDVIIARVYPIQYMEKAGDGGSLFRNERAENKAARVFEATRQRRMEEILNNVQRKMESENLMEDGKKKCGDRKKRWQKNEVARLQTGQEIYEACEQTFDPSDVQQLLSENQMCLLQEYKQRLFDEKQTRIRADFEEKLRSAETDAPSRTVVPLLKLRLVGCGSADVDSPCNIMLTIWRPAEDLRNMLKEGSRFKMYNLVASEGRGRNTGGISLTSGRTTQYEQMSVDDNLLDLVYEPREVSSLGYLGCANSSLFDEVNAVGVVVHISESSNRERSNMQVVYIADEQENACAIRFWGGLQAHALEDVIRLKAVLAFSNLQQREKSSGLFTNLTASELSLVTGNPRERHLISARNKLMSSIKDLGGFVGYMQTKVLSMMKSGFNMTPSRSVVSPAVSSATVMSRKQTSPDSIPVHDQTPGNHRNQVAKISHTPHTSHVNTPTSLPHFSGKRVFPAQTVASCTTPVMSRNSVSSSVGSIIRTVAFTPTSNTPLTSTSLTTPTEEEVDPVLSAKKSIQRQKISRLARYGSPPKLPPLNVHSTPVLRKAFKPPRRSISSVLPIDSPHTGLTKSHTATTLKTDENSLKCEKSLKFQDESNDVDDPSVKEQATNCTNDEKTSIIEKTAPNIAESEQKSNDATSSDNIAAKSSVRTEPACDLSENLDIDNNTNAVTVESQQDSEAWEDLNVKNVRRRGRRKRADSDLGGELLDHEPPPKRATRSRLSRK